MNRGILLAPENQDLRAAHETARKQAIYMTDSLYGGSFFRKDRV